MTMKKSFLLLPLLALSACSAPAVSSSVPASEAEESSAVSSSEETPASDEVLVAYFSATDRTERIAGYANELLGGGFYEILPADPYTSEDLNYNDDASRTSIENNDPDARPEITGSVEDFEKYSLVLLGYPIWFGKAPKIIHTFMEAYDWSEKTILPFCTSGGSGIANSVSILSGLYSAPTWLEGHRFSGSATKEDVSSWLSSVPETKDLIA